MTPLPVLINEPPVPRITPLTSVERLLLPTVSWFGPREKVPAPSIEPAVIAPLDREVMSNAPPAVVMKRALPPVALSAVLALRKKMFAWLPMIKVGALEEPLTMPVPVILIDVVMPSDVMKLYAGALALNCSVPIDVVVKGWNAIKVVFDGPKNAVPVGTVAGVQLAAVLKFPEPGLTSQVASCARAGNAASNATAAVVVSKCARIAPPPLRNAQWAIRSRLRKPRRD